MVVDRHLADVAGAIREIRRAQITRGLTAREPPETVYTLYTEAIIAVACCSNAERRFNCPTASPISLQRLVKDFSKYRIAP